MYLAESQGFSQTASQSDVLRKPFRLAWTLRYCMLHRSLQLNAQALSCSNPIDLKKNTPFQAYFLAESQGFSQTASQSDVLRKPFQLAWTLRYCMLHRSLQLNAQALSCSNPIDLKKNTPFQAYFLAESQGFEPWVRLRTQHFECFTPNTL